MIKKLKRFVRKCKRDKRYRAVIAIILALVLFGWGRLSQAKVDREKFEAQRATIVAEYESRMDNLRAEHEAELVSMKDSYETPTIEDIYKVEAEYIAKVLYGTAPNHSERDQRTVVWCILNRVDHHGYPDTVEGVCKQASQWIGYSDDNPIMTNLYDIAMGELITWHSNYRPVSEDFIYMSWSSKEISLRNTYESKSSTRHWQAN